MHKLVSMFYGCEIYKSDKETRCLIIGEKEICREEKLVRMKKKNYNGKYNNACEEERNHS